MAKKKNARQKAWYAFSCYIRHRDCLLTTGGTALTTVFVAPVGTPSRLNDCRPVTSYPDATTLSYSTLAESTRNV